MMLSGTLVLSLSVVGRIPDARGILVTVNGWVQLSRWMGIGLERACSLGACW